VHPVKSGWLCFQPLEPRVVDDVGTFVLTRSVSSAKIGTGDSTQRQLGGSPFKRVVVTGSNDTKAGH
jgi:hypothetical protein